MEQAIIRKKNKLSPVWILPLVALCVGGWLLYTSYRDKGIEVMVHFTDAKGITPGKTKVIVKGIPVGTVRAVRVDDDLRGVHLILEMENRIRNAIVKDSKFWIVKPEISAGRISGLDTLLSGAYIGFRKGASTQLADIFEGLSSPPPLPGDIPGLRISIETDNLYSLQQGSHLYSKNLLIGHVDDYVLQDNGKISLQVFVKPQFAHLIKTGTRFWNSSGISVSGNLQTGISVNVESVSSLIYGGISCATPPALEHTDSAENNSVFRLFKDFDDAEYGLNMTLQIASGEGIVPGKTQMMYRGLKAGVVKSIDVNTDKFHTVTASILLDPRASVILKENTKFWIVKPQVSITGIKHLETIFTGPYLTFEAGDGPYCDHFVVEPKPVIRPPSHQGTSFVLVSAQSNALEAGAPVLYKQMKVGEVTAVGFGPKGESIHTTILIYEPYDRFITSKSVFWNVSGIQIDGSLSNFEINLTSLQTMLAGGIGVVNPPGTFAGKPKIAAAGSHFSLYDSYTNALKAEPLLKPKGLHLLCSAPEIPSLLPGAPVTYNNIKVGEVLSFDLANNRQDTVVELLITEKYRDLITTKSRFYNFSGLKINASLQGLTFEAGALDSILAGGISFVNLGKGKPVKNRHNFTLHTDRQHAIHAGAQRLTLHFVNGAGIGKHTKIKYQGIDIGKITDIDLNPETGGVTGTGYVIRDASKLFREETLLWLVKPEINLTGVRNLGTILTGPHIEVDKGSGSPQTEFSVLERSPAKPGSPGGLQLTLEAPRLGSLKKGSPLYYRQVHIGQVIGFNLSPTAQAVWVDVYIEPPYAKLVFRGTRFWNASGIRVTGGVLSGMSIDTESMESIIRGGIALATPEGEEIGRPAKNGDLFHLAAKAEPAWLKWRPELPSPKGIDQQPSTGQVPKEGREAEMH